MGGDGQCGRRLACTNLCQAAPHKTNRGHTLWPESGHKLWPESAHIVVRDVRQAADDMATSLWPESGHRIAILPDTYQKTVATFWPQFVAMLG